MQTLSPSPDSSLRGNWWQRNWKWFVPVTGTVLLSLMATFIAVVFFAVSGAMKSSGAYQHALHAARENPEVIAALGQPIRDGHFTAGNIHVEGPSGAADLQIPLSGPKGKGDLYLVASKAAGTWTFSTLAVQLDGGRRIDLLQSSSP